MSITYLTSSNLPPSKLQRHHHAHNKQLISLSTIRTCNLLLATKESQCRRKKMSIKSDFMQCGQERVFFPIQVNAAPPKVYKTLHYLTPSHGEEDKLIVGVRS